MEILKNYNLSKLNTLGINVEAKFFVEVQSEKDLKELFVLPEFKNNKKMFLGGGSNVLFTKDFDGMVVLNKLRGIEITEEDSENVYIRGAGGELWHDLVMFAVNHGYWGIENLSFIPGTVGAAPVQNIGAYGLELKDVLFNVETFEIETGIKRIFSKEECKLGYRDSVFKNKLKNKYFISAITLKLSKKEKRNIKYKILSDFLEKNKIEIKSPKDISDAVMCIRQSKLPDPKIIGNAGSFFKNVFVGKEQLQVLQISYPEIPHFENNGIIKIPAAWLVEQCGWKGHRVGNVGVHEKQALVLVNYGEVKGLEILELANKIIASVKEKFGLDLVPEVNIV
ncbi:MAG: UDP-N-acetylmuramate dehydrogenase [Candidatus Pacebacteria bacterium]|nr:UDP-N-acetylmuramate dehydrogenase [Candidatus Paceibacterota bacterium]